MQCIRISAMITRIADSLFGLFSVWILNRTFPLRKNQNLTIIMSENESLSYLLFHVLK